MDRTPALDPRQPTSRRYADQRVAYDLGSLSEQDLRPDPLAQFAAWFEVAEDSGLAEPNAMVLSTVDAAGSPTSRTVLLKAADARGFVFFTGYTSRKALAIEANAQVALLFPWFALHRQVAVRGVARRLPTEESAAYFVSRPWGSRVGAWASHQSQPLPGRELLEQRFEELAARWPDRGGPDDVPVPGHWGGYLVTATEVEFWQGRASRLHDRLVYLAKDPAGAELSEAAGWRIERRQP